MAWGRCICRATQANATGLPLSVQEFGSHIGSQGIKSRFPSISGPLIPDP
jgi:hypothetical protein